MSKRNVTKTWGTWYTAEGERADSWPAEARSAGGPTARPREALVASSRHGLSGGPGLAGVVEARLASANPIASLF